MNDVVRPNGLKEAVGISLSTAWRMEQKGLFPKRRELSTGTVGWLREDLEEWKVARRKKGEPAS